jgi:hypothetical protein
MQYKIYDAIAENISIVNNYRSQFNRLIVNSSFEELMKDCPRKHRKHGQRLPFRPGNKVIPGLNRKQRGLQWDWPLLGTSV